MAPAGPTGRFVRDARVDRGVHWAIATLLVLGLGGVTWHFKGLDSGVRSLSAAVAQLSTEVQVMRAERKKTEEHRVQEVQQFLEVLKDHEKRIRALEAK